MRRAGLSVIASLGLGSNRGDRAAALCSAVDALAAHGLEVQRLSAVYESDYWGPGSPQAPYLNAVAVVRTGWSPLELLDVLQAIERAHGRAPGTHGRPRPLDLDLLTYGGFRIRHPRLVVPHPRMCERRFVLEPLAELGLLSGAPELAARLAAVQQQALRRHGWLERVGGRCEARVA